MKIFLMILIILSGCATAEKKEPVPEKKAVVREIRTGWLDEDTYRVLVTAPSEDEGIYMARHQILKDIVNVRIKNVSPYTDIKKIQSEFSEPFKNGIVIEKKVIEGGLSIYYEIREKGLREKFERK